MELHTPNMVGTIVFLFILALPWLIGIAVIVLLVITLLRRIPQPYSKRAALFLVSLVSSMVLVLLTLWLSKTINTTSDINQLNNIECGWPVPYVVFNSSQNPPPLWTESCIGWSGSPMDTQKTFSWNNFLLNLVLIGGVLWILIKVADALVMSHKLHESKAVKHKSYESKE